MGVTPESAAQIATMEWSAMGLFALVVFATLVAFVYVVKKVIPALIAYLKEKDEQHRQDILNIMSSGREERDKFYATLAVKLDRVHDRIDEVREDVRNEVGEVKDRLGRIEITITKQT